MIHKLETVSDVLRWLTIEANGGPDGRYGDKYREGARLVRLSLIEERQRIWKEKGKVSA